MIDNTRLSVLPGGERIARGLDALTRGELDHDALLVCIAAPSLRQLGFDVPSGNTDDPERALYAELSKEDPEHAHAAYNALVQEAASFARAVECATQLTKTV